MKNVKIILFLSSCCWYCQALEFLPKHLQNLALQVKLPQGTVQGKLKETTERKLRYFSFEGIPFAAPPVGNLRFKAPVPAQKWKGVLNASGIISCVQVTPAILNNLVDINESEDCLYINVYTPVKDLQNVKKDRLLSVMAWIYGGGFIVGSPILYGPEYLLEENVVVVHFGYRLASFGFLSTEDLECPGNYGLKDQHLALRWVKNNIKYFGGDPDKITIFGESAGSASVQLQLMYPKNEGLFRSAISESGSILCIWALQREPRKLAFELGRSAGINTNSSKKLIKYLQGLSMEKLKSATAKISIKNAVGIFTGIPFAPSIEPEHPGAFLANKPHQLLQEGRFLKVPYTIGFNSAEAVVGQFVVTSASPLLFFYDIDPNILVPSGMNAGKHTNEVGTSIKEFYLSDRLKTEQYVEYINDEFFYRPITESIRLFNRSTSIFMYCFSYEGESGRKFFMLPKFIYKGVSHAEEMTYIWSINYLPEPNSADKIVKDRMVRMWANFAKTGSPTPKRDQLLENISWPTFSSNMDYLDINTNLKIKQHFRNKSLTFWKKLYEKYGRPPYDTY